MKSADNQKIKITNNGMVTELAPCAYGNQRVCPRLSIRVRAWVLSACGLSSFGESACILSKQPWNRHVALPFGKCVETLSLTNYLEYGRRTHEVGPAIRSSPPRNERGCDPAEQPWQTFRSVRCSAHRTNFLPLIFKRPRTRAHIVATSPTPILTTSFDSGFR